MSKPSDVPEGAPDPQQEGTGDGASPVTPLSKTMAVSADTESGIDSGGSQGGGSGPGPT